MNRWQRVTDLFNAALERQPAERAAFLDAACASDADLRAEVESLLAAHDAADGFLEALPPPASASPGDRAPAIDGQMLGPYRIDREIGRGGFGVVHLAEDTRLGRQVAIKVLSSEFLRDPARRDRLRLEARAAAALSHPGIATVYSLEEFEDRLCLVTEYVQGDTLRSEIERGPLGLDLVIDTGIQVARGLAAAHAAGVIHRDLKPENLVRSRQGSVKILDFGIARVDAPLTRSGLRLTEAGTILGTPGYMSPEQIEGSDVDARSDIFALGVVLFELATGRHPFAGSSPLSTTARILAANPPPLSSLDPRLPPALDAIVRKCLRRHRTDRYGSALDVAQDLEDLRGGRARAPAGRLPARTSGVFSPRWWWRLHQVTAMAVEAGLVYLVWLVYSWARTDWTLAAFLATIATAAVNGTLRMHLLFTSAFNAADMPGQLRRTQPLVRGTDLVLSVLLLLSAAPVAHPHVSIAATLAAFGVGWLATSLVVEPATRKAAFPD
jgi:hypothetical protein